MYILYLYISGQKMAETWPTKNEIQQSIQSYNRSDNSNNSKGGENEKQSLISFQTNPATENTELFSSSHLEIKVKSQQFVLKRNPFTLYLIYSAVLMHQMALNKQPGISRSQLYCAPAQRSGHNWQT